MEVERFTAVAPFAARTRAFLEGREAEHNLLLGLLGRLELDPAAYGDANLCLAAVVAGGEIAGVALQTPPHNLVLSTVQNEAAVDALAAALHGDGRAFSGVVGPVTTADRFAESWRRLTGVSARVDVAERIYEATAAVPPRGVGGGSRPYREGDRPLVLAWLEDFAAEAVAAPSRVDAASVLAHRLADSHGGFVLWEDGGHPVSVTGYGGTTPNGIRIGPVYTPPGLRRRGYASALVADMTAALLAGGRRSCFLFTDLANPTSNAIYQRVGYRPVADVNQWGFEPA